MSFNVSAAAPDEIPALLGNLARLRIAVFREWPYLYDGSTAYEENYLRTFAQSPNAVIAIARNGTEIVGAATASPLLDHDPAFATPLIAAGYDPACVFYFAESVLLPEYRGQGAGHAFFDIRESAAKERGFRHATFCSVIRPPDHPLRPEGYQPLAPFWTKRGYAPLNDAVVHFDWRDLGASSETAKPLQVWIRQLS